MNKEIDISDVPLTPRGENHDFKSVKNFEFVRFEKDIKFRTTALIYPEPYVSDNEIDLNSLKTDKERVSAIIKSPMIEVRKKRKSVPSLGSEEKIRLNPKRDDVLETSAGCLKNYQQSRRKTIAVMKRMSTKIKQPGKRNHSLPNIDKENLSVQDNMEMELSMLVVAIEDSQTLLEVEEKRLNDLIGDWSHILQSEDDIPNETRGDIESAIGGLQILLNSRFRKTLDLLKLAVKYVDNNGIKLLETDKDYQSQDIYGFVDLLINEIKNIDKEFNVLYIKHENKWVDVSPVIVEAKKTVVTKPKLVAKKPKKVVKSQIDIASLRNKFHKKNARVSGTIEIHVAGSSKKDKNDGLEIDSSFNNIGGTTMKKTPTSSVKKGIRQKTLLKSTTGTPVHYDTPRPLRSRKVESSKEFLEPSANALSKRIARKRSVAQSSLNGPDLFVSPVTLPKRMSRRNTKGKESEQ